MKNLFLFLVFLPFISGAQVITTIAGNGTGSYSGDGGSATTAEINNPDGLYGDTLGNIFLADQANNCIRKISASGIIRTIAGNGMAGSGGDGGQATASQLNAPADVVVDGAGNVYIAEYLSNRIRKINTSGIITTIAGTGTAGYMGDTGPATAALLNGPDGICADALGNLYVADGHNQCIRKINASGIITTIAGTGTYGYNGDGIAATTAQLSDPFGVAVDAAGNIFIADQDSHRIRKINTSGIITTIAGTGTVGSAGDGGPATAALLNDPTDVFPDAAGNIFIADKLGGVVRKIDPTGIIITVAGTGISSYSGDGGLATAAELNWPSFVFVNSGSNIYISDYQNNRIRMVSSCVNSITYQPIPDTVLVSHNATYTVTTTMPSPVYQWQEDEGSGFVNLANVLPYSGVYTNTLTINNVVMLFNNSHYRCVITNGVSCADTSSSAILIIHGGTGVNQISAEEINIFPNPAHDNIIVQFPGQINTGSVQLLNEIGQLIVQQEINSGQQTLNVSKLPAGMYVMKIFYNDQVFNKKIFIN